MALHCISRTVSIAIFAFLLLVLGGCAARGPVVQDNSAVLDDVAPALDSPLLSFAADQFDQGFDLNHVELLEIGDRALLARVHLIRSASDSISLQTMIWANDETGRYLIYELIQAARRGVKVRLLIDHLASEQDVEIASFLARVQPNFQIKFFNPVTGFFGQLKAEPSYLDKLYAILFSFNRLNQRMHNKTFIVDQRIGISGGRNYQNAYYDQASRMNYKDRDLLVVGPVVREMQRSFDRYWTFDRSISIGDLADVKKYFARDGGKTWKTRSSFQLGDRFDVMDLRANDAALIYRLLVQPLTEVDQVEFVADEPYKRDRSDSENYSRITRELAFMVGQAKESITIQTPYLVLSSDAIELFRQIRREHPQIEVRISTNSLAATDSWYVYALSYKQKKTYLTGLGFKIYEIMPLPGDLRQFMPGYERLKARVQEQFALRADVNQEQAFTFEDEPASLGSDLPGTLAKPPYLCLHAKSLVVDDLVAFIGSYNLDPRSEKINTECGFVIRDADFSRRLKQVISRDMQPQNSWAIAAKKRFVGIDETNAVLVELSNLIPLVDPWPFRYSASFELIEGKAPVDIGDPEFYDNYRDIGSFPRVKIEDTGKKVGALGTKSFLSFVRPLL